MAAERLPLSAEELLSEECAASYALREDEELHHHAYLEAGETEETEVQVKWREASLLMFAIIYELGHQYAKSRSRLMKGAQ